MMVGKWAVRMVVMKAEVMVAEKADLMVGLLDKKMAVWKAEKKVD